MYLIDVIKKLISNLFEIKSVMTNIDADGINF